MSQQSIPQRAVIVTALSVEYRAVRGHLASIREVTHPRGTVYEVGHFSSDCGSIWEVALVEIGAGNAGAAMEAERAISYFDPKVALFVGVAGGLKDVQIGDVVAATKIYGYESGKADTEFMPRPDVGRSTYRMEQRARAEARKEDWLVRIGARPVPLPRVFVGPITAGEKVVSSLRSPVFEFIRSAYGDALAVEMEGRGFLQATAANQQVDSLVIRGTSDLIAGKTSADAGGSQEVAARHAAAFGFQVLARLTLDDDQTRIPWMVVFDATPEEMNRIMQAILGQIRDISGDVGVTLRKAEPGSVILDLEGSEGGFERIRSLFKAGRFTEISGFRILDVRPWEDVALIRAAISGDREAFGKLYESYKKRVLGYIAARSDQADNISQQTDIAQDTWGRVLEKLPSYEPSRASFEAFVKYTASLMLARYFRTRQRSSQHLVASLAEIEAYHLNELRADEVGPIRAEVRSVEDSIAIADQFDRLLAVTFGGSSPPHQLIAFAFTKLLDWKPMRLVEEFSNRPLDDLAHMAEKQYAELLPGRERFVRDCYRPLRESMDKDLGSVLDDFRTRELYRNLLGRKVRTTTLRDYFTGRAEDNISHWSLAVRRRALSDALAKGIV